jgi:hypothetical protein
MTNKLTDISQIRKALKFHFSGKSKLFISNYLSFSRNTVKKYIALFDALGLNLEDLEKKTDADLENLISQPTLESTNPTLEKLHHKLQLPVKKIVSKFNTKTTTSSAYYPKFCGCS